MELPSDEQNGGGERLGWSYLGLGLGVAVRAVSFAIISARAGEVG
jgi:hypothetical protein